MKQFLIGNVLLQIDYAGIPVISEGNLQKFRYDGIWEGETVQLVCSSEPLSRYTEQVLKRDNHVFGIYSYQGKQILIYHWGNLFHGFCVRPDQFTITFDPAMYTQTPIREDWFFSICAFHRQMLNRRACVLHASYVDIGGEAILFTGPSGIGKSTQADLWTRHAGAQIINGDRALLRKINGKWHVFGYPCCGTSGVCINRNLPLRAIVVLSQAQENRVIHFSAAEKIRTLVSATELYPWDPEEIGMAVDISQEIAFEIPVVNLRCRPDRDAVEVLKAFLEDNK